MGESGWERPRRQARGGHLLGTRGRPPTGGDASVSGTNGTEGNGAGRRRRRCLPAGWAVIAGGERADQSIDPTIQQTRELTYALFAASLLGMNVGFHRFPPRGRQAWSDHAMMRGDVGLANILDQLDDETFNDTWTALVRRLDAEGAPATVAWLQKRIVGSAL